MCYSFRGEIILDNTGKKTFSSLLLSPEDRFLNLFQPTFSKVHITLSQVEMELPALYFISGFLISRTRRKEVHQAWLPGCLHPRDLFNLPSMNSLNLQTPSNDESGKFSIHCYTAVTTLLLHLFWMGGFPTVFNWKFHVNSHCLMCFLLHNFASK